MPRYVILSGGLCYRRTGRASQSRDHRYMHLEEDTSTSVRTTHPTVLTIVAIWVVSTSGNVYA